MKRLLSILLAVLLAVPIITVSLISIQTKTKVKELFRLNKVLQEEGYYMAELIFCRSQDLPLHMLSNLTDNHIVNANAPLQDLPSWHGNRTFRC